MKEKQQVQAIVLTSYGCSFPGAKEKTLDKIKDELALAFPTCPIYTAWTSRYFLQKQKEAGENLPSVPQALEQLKDAGVTRVLIQPTHVLKGQEYRRLQEELDVYRSDFEEILQGDPLLESMEDMQIVATAVLEELSDIPKDAALVFMGHGADEWANQNYRRIEGAFEKQGREHVFVEPLNEETDFAGLLQTLAKLQPSKVYLAPLMLVAGNHAAHDLAGEEPESWKNRFIQAGFAVECIMKGLGEYKGVRKVYVEHAKKALLKKDKNRR